MLVVPRVLQVSLGFFMLIYLFNTNLRDMYKYIHAKKKKKKLLSMRSIQLIGRMQMKEKILVSGAELAESLIPIGLGMALQVLQWPA